MIFITFLKLIYRLIKKNNFLVYLLDFICYPLILISFIFIKINFFRFNFLILSFYISIHLKKINTSIQLLNNIESSNILNFTQLKKYYIFLFEISINDFDNRYLFIDFLLNKKLCNNYVYFYWKLIFEFYYFIGDIEKLSLIINEFQNLQNILKKKYNLSEDVNIYGNHLTGSIGQINNLFYYKIINDIKNKLNKDIVIINKNIIANHLFLNLFENYYEFKNIDFLLSVPENHREIIESNFLSMVEYNCKWNDIHEIRFEINNYYNNRNKNNSFLSLDNNTKEIGFQLLKSFGLSYNDWYVVFHVRASRDSNIRNCDISSYIKSIYKVVELGGWVFRIGDLSMPKLPKINKVVDLIGNIEKSFDIFLLATSKFAVVSASGPAEIPNLFRVPTVHTNVVHFRQLYLSYMDIGLPTVYFKDKKLIKFNELINLNISRSHISNSRNQYTINYNNENEICDAIIEINDNINSSNFSPTINQINLNNIINKNNYYVNGYISNSYILNNPDFFT